MSKHLKFEVYFLKYKWPLFALGFVGGVSEVILALWLVEFRLSWGC